MNAKNGLASKLEILASSKINELESEYRKLSQKG
jgi:hypothetical protein